MDDRIHPKKDEFLQRALRYSRISSPYLAPIEAVFLSKVSTRDVSTFWVKCLLPVDAVVRPLAKEILYWTQLFLLTNHICMNWCTEKLPTLANIPPLKVLP